MSFVQVSGSQIAAVLDIPFQLGPRDSLVFIDGSLQSQFPNACDPALFSQTNPLITSKKSGTWVF